MGIKNGAPDIIAIIRSGVYNKHARKFKIVVDGELMRYKGMIETNLCKHNAEEAIAATSFDYMKRVIDTIELFIGRRAVEIVIFMDGVRVFNKESCRADFKFDASLIRVTFKNICFQYGYTVNELTHGESELQMYLQRDKTMDMNVFLTNDSDMISICYGHQPVLKYLTDDQHNEDDVDDDDDFDDQRLVSVLEPAQRLQMNPTTAAAHGTIVDMNSIYNLDRVQVADSCLWINSGKVLTAVGFDFIERRMGFNKLVFRTFVAFCGTDFTSNLLTDSMISGILLSDKDDIRYVNTLANINDIACALIMLGLRANGTVKRYDSRAKGQQFSADSINSSIRMYLDYIDTGRMLNVAMARPSMGLACRHYLYAMRGQELTFVKGTLVNWARNTRVKDAVEQMREYLGTYNPNSEDIPRSRGTKRKHPRHNQKQLASITAAATTTAAAAGAYDDAADDADDDVELPISFHFDISTMMATTTNSHVFNEL